MTTEERDTQAEIRKDAVLQEYLLWCDSFGDMPRRPTMYAKMCWWHDKTMELLEKP